MTDARPQCDCPSHAVSASQIDTYKKCQRRWGFRKLSLRQEPETSFALAGKAIHERLEKYTLTGDLPHRDSDKYAKPVWAVVKHLPAPHNQHRCEQHIRLNLPGGLVIHGYPDLVPFDGSTPARSVVDYKTVSVRKTPFEFALTPDQLKADTQALVYAQAVSGALGSTQLKWLYIERQPPYRVRVVETTLTSLELRNGMARVMDIVREMYAHRTKSAALWHDDSSDAVDNYVNSLPASTDHCGAYGGCPHAAICTAYKPPAFFQEFSKMGNSSLDDLISQGNSKNVNAIAISERVRQVTERLKRSAPQPVQQQESVMSESEIDPINPPVEDDEEGDDELKKKLEAAVNEHKQKKADAQAAREAKARAKAEAEAKANAKQATKIDPPKAQSNDTPAETQESAEPATPVSPTTSGFSIEIRAIASGDSLQSAVAFLKENVAKL